MEGGHYFPCFDFFALVEILVSHADDRNKTTRNILPNEVLRHLKSCRHAEIFHSYDPTIEGYN